MNMLDTLKGSYFSEILPKGWDIEKINACVSNDPATVLDRQSFWMTLRHGPATAIIPSYIPTMPGKLFFMEELAGPLCPDTN